MKIYATKEEKKIIKDCFNYFPDKELFNSIRYIMNVNDSLLPKTVYFPFDDKSFEEVEKGGSIGIYVDYGENIYDIFYNIKNINELSHIIIHELAHYFFDKKKLTFKWNRLFFLNKSFLNDYSKNNVFEFFAEHYTTFTTENGKKWLKENRPDILLSIENIWKNKR